MTNQLHELTLNAIQRAEEIAGVVASKDLPKKLVNRLTVILAISSMEGLAYQLKESISEISLKEKMKRKKLTELFPYLEAGSDSRTTIGDNGTLNQRPARHRSLPHILFSLRYAAYYYDISLNPFKITGWRYVKNTFKVRDRVIHPRKESALSVSETERNDALKAFLWYKRCLLEIERGVPSS